MNEKAADIILYVEAIPRACKLYVLPVLKDYLTMCGIVFNAVVFIVLFGGR